MEFGPEIKVDGKRPEWLEGYTGPVKWWNCDQRNGVVCPNADKLNWGAYPGRCDGGITNFALPANHPYYATPTPDERAVAPELVARLVGLVKEMASQPGPEPRFIERARAIVAALEPVDPMLLEARQVVADLYTSNAPHLREQALSGEGDEWFHTKVARAALARGRQLQRDSVTGVTVPNGASITGEGRFTWGVRVPRDADVNGITGVTLGTREQFEKDCG